MGLAEQNLRMIIKSNALYTQIKRYLQEHFEDILLPKNLFVWCM